MGEESGKAWAMYRSGVVNVASAVGHLLGMDAAALSRFGQALQDGSDCVQGNRPPGTPIPDADCRAVAANQLRVVLKALEEYGS